MALMVDDVLQTVQLMLQPHHVHQICTRPDSVSANAGVNVNTGFIYSA